MLKCVISRYHGCQSGMATRFPRCEELSVFWRATRPSNDIATLSSRGSGNRCLVHIQNYWLPVSVHVLEQPLRPLQEREHLSCGAVGRGNIFDRILRTIFGVRK
jgi:hypothetical protein